LDEKAESGISGERKKELCWTRLVYLEQAKHYSDAIAWANELIKDARFTAQERLRLRRRIAVNLNWMNRTEEALVMYDQVLAEVDKVEPEQKAGILRDKADVYWYAKRYQEALDVHNTAMKLTEPNTVRWVDEQAWQIRLLARLGRADAAWAAYVELTKSSVTTPQDRLNLMALIAFHLQECGSTVAAHDAALKTRHVLDSLPDPSVDVAEARGIVDKILAVGYAEKVNGPASELMNQ
jgi:tetratricopeptide (TPR) repeat protein